MNTLNLHSTICRLCLNKPGRKKKRKKNTRKLWQNSCGHLETGFFLCASCTVYLTMHIRSVVTKFISLDHLLCISVLVIHIKQSLLLKEVCVQIFHMNKWDKCPRMHLLGCTVPASQSTQTTLHFHKWLWGLGFSTSSPAPFQFSHLDRCVTISHCYFHLHFLDGWRRPTSCYVGICHLCIFLSEMTLRALCPLDDALFSYSWALRDLLLFQILVLCQKCSL